MLALDLLFTVSMPTQTAVRHLLSLPLIRVRIIPSIASTRRPHNLFTLLLVVIAKLSLNAILIMGDGRPSNGITGDQSFKIELTGSYGYIEDLLYCCSFHEFMKGFVDLYILANLNRKYRQKFNYGAKSLTFLNKLVYK